MSKFYVIGGQYRFVCYGGADTLRGAKLLATKHEEYWDNWQGWHTPCIYRAEDCTVSEDGKVSLIRGRYTLPCAWKEYGKWCGADE